MARRLGVLLIALLCPATPALAGSITFDLDSLGGSHFRYTYTVINEEGGAPIQGFDIFFDPWLYDESSLTVAAPEGWDPIVLGSMSGPIPIAYDVLALDVDNDGDLDAGVTPGTSLSGFVVDFTWLGTGLPGPQPFEFYDPSDFSVIAQGTTTPATAVPDPASGAGLLVMGLLSLALLRRRA